jgi:pimeloyl-ACP methyl ester carboxylesterase
VKDIDIPTLIFWGELDVLFDASNAEHLHAALPQSKLQILPEAGHLAWADQPEFFANMVIDWVDTAHQ